MNALNSTAKAVCDIRCTRQFDGRARSSILLIAYELISANLSLPYDHTFFDCEIFQFRYQAKKPRYTLNYPPFFLQT